MSDYNSQSKNSEDQREIAKGYSAFHEVLKGNPRPNHKYYKRVPDGKGGWQYYYTKEEWNEHQSKDNAPQKDKEREKALEKGWNQIKDSISKDSHGEVDIGKFDISNFEATGEMIELPVKNPFWMFKKVKLSMNPYIVSNEYGHYIHVELLYQYATIDNKSNKNSVSYIYGEEENEVWRH